MDRLMSYPWPGNIRELENIVERALILAGSPVLSIEPELLPLSVPGMRKTMGHAPPGGTGHDGSPAHDLESVQREHILAVLRQSKWVVEGEQGAAVRLGMKPATLRHRMKKLGISRSGAPG